MPTTQGVTREALARLERVIEGAGAIDWRATSLEGSGPAEAALRHGDGADGGEIVELLRAYQRLLRVLPAGEEARALPMLGAGLHSAVQIAGLPKHEFARRWAGLFPGAAALGEAVHRSAVARRSHLVLHRINAVQCNEPHYRAARFR
ncbi:MAG TPA: hypothetical protein VFS43_10075 [Polyangiaceae bacterium]|nr:hypothetical protein [Polyangiaceae bacterium]